MPTHSSPSEPSKKMSKSVKTALGGSTIRSQAAGKALNNLLRRRGGKSGSG